MGKKNGGLTKPRGKVFFRHPEKIFCGGGGGGGGGVGWVGGDILGPLIFLKIGYNNKQDVLIPNMASKVVYGH